LGSAVAQGARVINPGEKKKVTFKEKKHMCWAHWGKGGEIFVGIGDKMGREQALG